LRLRVAPKAPPRHARSHGGALAYVRSLLCLTCLLSLVCSHLSALTCLLSLPLCQFSLCGGLCQFSQ
jgi:hypothetical protein